MSTEQPQIIREGPMARRLRVPVRWLREQAASGRVPAIPAGRGYLFNPAAVEAALASRASTPVNGGRS